MIPSDYKVDKKIAKIGKKEHYVVTDVSSGEKLFLVLFKPKTKTEEKEKKFLSLFEKLKQIQSVTVLNPSKYFITEAFGLLYPAKDLVLLEDLIPNITLKIKAKSVNLRELFLIFGGILFGMIKTYKSGINFGFVTPVNVVVNKEMKPSIFGGCLESIEENDKCEILDSFYAPEFSSTLKTNEKTDVYSFSTLMNMCMTSKQFTAKKVEAKRNQMHDLTPPFLKMLMIKCWSNDPNKRPHFHELLQLLFIGTNRFFRNYDNQMYYDYLREIGMKLNIFPIEFKGVADCVSALSQSTKEFAVKIMRLQCLLGNIIDWFVDETAKWILANFVKKHDIKYVSSAFIGAANTRCMNIELYVSLIKKLEPINDEVIEQIVNSLFQVGKRNDPYPNSEGTTALVFLFATNEMITSSFLVEKIRDFYEQSQNKVISNLFFAWFAPFIHKEDKSLFDKMYEMIKKQAGNEFTDDIIKDFFNKFEEYKKDDFKFYKTTLAELKTDSELINNIRGDNALKVYDMMLEAQHAKVPKTIFEPNSLASETMIISSYAALYGSSKVFQNMSLTKNVFIENDKVIRKLLAYSVAGGSESIVDAVVSHGGEASDVMMVSTEYHRESIFETYVMKVPDVREPDRSGKLLINMAARSNNVFAMFRLLAMGASPNGIQTFGWTPLHSAAESGACEIVEILLKHPDTNPNAKDVWGKTPLCVAADNGNFNVIHVLIKYGKCDVNSVCQDGRTAMHFAAGTGCIESLRMLKKGGANINAKDNKGRTPLHVAAEVNAKATQYLLGQRGIDARAVDSKGRTVYDLAKLCHRDDTIKILEDYAEKNSCLI